MHTAEHTVSEEEIARRAYELWQARGCPPGDGTEDWEEAVAELTGRNGRRNGAKRGGLLGWLSRRRRAAVSRAS